MTSFIEDHLERVPFAHKFYHKDTGNVNKEQSLEAIRELNAIVRSASCLRKFLRDEFKDQVHMDKISEAVRILKQGDKDGV